MAVPKSKKRKLSHEQPPGHNDVEKNTSKPTAVFNPTGGRSSTLSVALPGSIIANAKSHEQKTYLAGTIARALAVFCVDEVIIFDDEPHTGANGTSNNPDLEGLQSHDNDDHYTAFSDPSHFLAHILSYLETPPYLRKYLFPMHRNLRTAGTLPSLDMPHHMRTNEKSLYREGVTVVAEDASDDLQDQNPPQRSAKAKKASLREASSETGTLVDIGLPYRTHLSKVMIPPNTRITLKFKSATASSSEADAVTPSAPREEAGYYWGYTIRRCPSISTVLTECPFAGGYDLSFGTSERGTPLGDYLYPPPEEEDPMKPPPPFKHLLVTFGGVAGLEVAVKADQVLAEKGVTEPESLFDYWVNVCPGQGSRTIRTEEAVWVGLAGLRELVEENEGRLMRRAE